MHLRLSGVFLVAAAVAAPLLWLPGHGAGRDTIALFSQYLGMTALITMAISQIIATRAPGVEMLFGGLDRGYVLHKWLGLWALLAMFLHDTIDAEMDGLGRETILVEAAETAGEIAINGFLILIVITVATFIPYHLWKWTHRFIGLFFALAAFHYLLILKPFSNLDPLGLYVGGFCVAGLLAYGWTQLPARLRPGHMYTVSNIAGTGTARAIALSPSARGMTHRAGQFAMLRFDTAGGAESHPFTLSAAPREDRSLEVTMAELGDGTRRLGRDLSVGTKARLEGPFGTFTMPRGSAPQIWIAAGIGITPFLALAETLPREGPPIPLIYCVRSERDAPQLERLRALAERTSLDLTLWQSGKNGRLTADDIAEIAGSDLASATVLFCGPTPMRRDLAKGLRAHGVSAGRFRYEAFELRTGIGLQRLAARLWNDVTARRMG